MKINIPKDSQKLAWFSITEFFSFSVSSVPTFLGLFIFICTVIDSVSLNIFCLYCLKEIQMQCQSSVP